jgi:hypothetical protein
VCKIFRNNYLVLNEILKIQVQLLYLSYNFKINCTLKLTVGSTLILEKTGEKKKKKTFNHEKKKILKINII